MLQSGAPLSSRNYMPRRKCGGHVSVRPCSMLLLLLLDIMVPSRATLAVLIADVSINAFCNAIQKQSWPLMLDFSITAHPFLPSISPTCFPIHSLIPSNTVRVLVCPSMSTRSISMNPTPYTPTKMIAPHCASFTPFVQPGRAHLSFVRRRYRRSRRN